jgi:hypothetical protein
MRGEYGACASKSALSAAARGQRLPNWETAWEFVRVLAVDMLGRDPADAEREWRARWELGINSPNAVTLTAVVTAIAMTAARGPGGGPAEAAPAANRHVRLGGGRHPARGRGSPLLQPG